VVYTYTVVQLGPPIITGAQGTAYVYTTSRRVFHEASHSPYLSPQPPSMGIPSPVREYTTYTVVQLGPPIITGAQGTASLVGNCYNDVIRRNARRGFWPLIRIRVRIREILTEARIQHERHKGQNPRRAFRLVYTYTVVQLGPPIITGAQGTASLVGNCYNDVIRRACTTPNTD
jgi:hypothetical protein